MTVEQKTRIQECIEREYRFYNEVVPYIDLVEVYFGAIKDGMLNDIRKFMGHIASAATADEDEPEVRLENLNDAHRHMRRILLDCYKLMCIHQQDCIKEFKRKFRFFNTNDVDDGNFDVKLNNMLLEAERLFKEAKGSDNTGKNDKKLFKYSLESELPEEENIVAGLDEVYEKYCIAYNSFCDAVNYINDHYEGVIRVAKKHVLGTIVSFAGWALGIILSVVLFFAEK